MTAISPSAYTRPQPFWWMRTVGLVFGDLISTLVFAMTYGLTHALAPAFVLALAAGGAGLVWTRLRGRRIDAMQSLSVGLTIVFGAAAVVTRDPRWVMLKPSLIYGAVAAVMLRPGWMLRYVPVIAAEHAGEATRRFGLVWAMAMGAIAAANLALALHGDARLWAAFLAVGPLALKGGLAGVQYMTTRALVRRRIFSGAPPAFTGD